MKFTAVLTILIVAVATAVGAVPSVETNAFRLARGLPPLPPGKRATPVSRSSFLPALELLLLTY